MKQQVDEFGLEGKEGTKFLKKNGGKHAKLGKERFESELQRLKKKAEQKRLKAEEKRLKMATEDRRWKKNWRKTFGKREGRKKIRKGAGG